MNVWSTYLRRGRSILSIGNARAVCRMSAGGISCSLGTWDFISLAVMGCWIACSGCADVNQRLIYGVGGCFAGETLEIISCANRGTMPPPDGQGSRRARSMIVERLAVEELRRRTEVGR